MIKTGEDDDGAERLYLVRETKASEHPEDLYESERLKVACGEKHFVKALGVDYGVATDVDDLKEYVLGPTE